MFMFMNLIATINYSIKNSLKEFIVFPSKQDVLEEFKSTCKVEVSH